MHWICNIIPDNITLHCLYTSIRFKDQKVDLGAQTEEFKIWKDGKSIYIIMDEKYIENMNTEFKFSKDKIICRLKDKNIFLVENETLSFLNKLNKFEDPFFTISGQLIYTYKYRKNEKKVIEVCPIGINGLIKEHTHNPTLFLDYLQSQTGLDFKRYASQTDKVRFERIFTDEKVLHDALEGNCELGKETKLLRNVISIHANLPSLNKDITQKLFYNSIGRKRNYGFGSLNVE